MTIKRLNYFTGQFLEADDFKAEQDYHIDMRQRGNRALYYSAGILEGLVVTQAIDAQTKIVISAGIGIDIHGMELVITEPKTVSLPLNIERPSVFVALSYKPEPTDKKEVADTVIIDGVPTPITIKDATRQQEDAAVTFEYEGAVPANAIVIAKITIDTTGKLIGSIDASMRPLANARFPNNVIVGQGGNGVLKTRHIDGKNCVPGPTVDDNDHLYLNWNTGKDVYLGFGEYTKSSLHVSGNATIGSNPIRFTSAWSEFPADSVTNHAEISNDTSSYKSFMILGNRSADPGVRRVSVWDRLEVNGDLQVADGSNPIRFTSEYSGFPDILTGNPSSVVRNHAEISNDTLNFKALAIFGNRSADPGVRLVSVYDRLEVNGVLDVTSDAFLGGNMKINNANPASDVGFKNTLTAANIVKAWGLIQTGPIPKLLDGFNIENVLSGGSTGTVLINLKEKISGFICITGNAHTRGAFVNFTSDTHGTIVACGSRIDPMGTPAVDYIRWDIEYQYFSIVVMGKQW